MFIYMPWHEIAYEHFIFRPFILPHIHVVMDPST